ncbi:hypothetical protein SNE510_00530 [Streptomyces sp. NE5-10]|nr:hypothetical protein SNE510_00530 [Streptomyces sp. NE5-10]
MDVSEEVVLHVEAETDVDPRHAGGRLGTAHGRIQRQSRGRLMVPDQFVRTSLKTAPGIVAESLRFQHRLQGASRLR